MLWAPEPFPLGTANMPGEDRLATARKRIQRDSQRVGPLRIHHARPTQYLVHALANGFRSKTPESIFFESAPLQTLFG